MNTQKEARRDAQEFARAQMYYGEGAGNRRKIIQAVVDGKAVKDPGYAFAFRRELSRQDKVEHAIKARRERERKDAARALNTNARGVMTGNYQGVNTIVLILATAGFFAHKTGLDIKLYEAAQKKVQDFRKKHRDNRRASSVHNIKPV